MRAHAEARGALGVNVPPALFRCAWQCTRPQRWFCGALARACAAKTYPLAGGCRSQGSKGLSACGGEGGGAGSQRCRAKTYPLAGGCGSQGSKGISALRASTPLPLKSLQLTHPPHSPNNLAQLLPVLQQFAASTSPVIPHTPTPTSPHPHPHPHAPVSATGCCLASRATPIVRATAAHSGVRSPPGSAAAQPGCSRQPAGTSA
eukprot:71523-Chlamydomonas_euryale.AAC.1